MDKKADPSNPILVEAIQTFERAEASFWNQVAENLGKVNRRRPEVNISDIERNTSEGDTVVVPGKVLGAGRLSKQVDVAAFKASNSARELIEEEGEFMFLQDLFEENPEAEGLKMVK